jgi:hypothetical protein
VKEGLSKEVILMLNSKFLSPYEPEQIDVIAPKGTPKILRTKKKILQVKEVVNTWRIDEDWWRKPISRLYFSLELVSGARLTVFRDVGTGQWYRQNWVETVNG